MTTVFNHISHSAQYHNMKHASCIFICINKTESLMFSKLKLIPIVLTWRVLYPVELFLKYLVNFINPHNMGLKYDIHFNRMSNYIIHSFYVVMGSFA